MNAKTIFGLVAATAFLASSASAKDKVNFDQGVDVPAVVGTLKSRAAKTLGVAAPFVKTYEVSLTQSRHAKGFAPHNGGAARSWVGHSDLEVSGMPRIPNTLDLRPRLTRIEDQGNCGSCWAFSLTATNRDGHALGSGDPGRLSQEWLVEHSPEASGCNGGDFDSADDFIKPAGQPLWKACPYDLGNGQCPAKLAPAASILSWHMLGNPKNGPSVRDIETYMTETRKPVSIAVAAGTGDWEYYAKGVYNGCVKGPLDHMINIVGWDNEGAKFNRKGNLPPGVGIWILRNSWGVKWGESGYMRTKMTDAKGVRCNEVAEQAAFFDFPADTAIEQALSRR